MRDGGIEIEKLYNNSMSLIQDFISLTNKQKAEILQRFFKTGKGEYGEGDKFLGITVPQTRKLAKKYRNLSLNEIKKLLNNKFHEIRLAALLILVEQFPDDPEKIYNFYLNNTKNINNWDLVDLSADKIVGKYLLKNPKHKNILKKLANSKNLWERRIAILSTYQLIKNNQFEEMLELAKKLLNDSHDLIHKATGWMLREIGKKSLKVEETFIRKFCKKMPRTMLRYAIEKFPKTKRAFYLNR